MNLIHFIISLIMRFVEVDEKEFAKTQSEAKTKWGEIRFDLENADCPKGPWNYIKFYAELWWVKLLLCLVFIWAVRALTDFMNPPKHTQNEDED